MKLHKLKWHIESLVTPVSTNILRRETTLELSLTCLGPATEKPLSQNFYNLERYIQSEIR